MASLRLCIALLALALVTPISAESNTNEEQIVASIVPEPENSVSSVLPETEFEEINEEDLFASRIKARINKAILDARTRDETEDDADLVQAATGQQPTLYGIRNGIAAPAVSIEGTCAGEKRKGDGYSCSGMKNYVGWHKELGTGDFIARSTFKVRLIRSTQLAFILWSGSKAASLTRARKYYVGLDGAGNTFYYEGGTWGEKRFTGATTLRAGEVGAITVKRVNNLLDVDFTTEGGHKTVIMSQKPFSAPVDAIGWQPGRNMIDVFDLQLDQYPPSATPPPAPVTMAPTQKPTPTPPEPDYGIWRGNLQPDAHTLPTDTSCKGKLLANEFQCASSGNYIKWSRDFGTGDFDLESSFEPAVTKATGLAFVLWSNDQPLYHIILDGTDSTFGYSGPGWGSHSGTVKSTMRSEQFQTIKVVRKAGVLTASIIISMEAHTVVHNIPLNAPIDGVGWMPSRNSIKVADLRLLNKDQQGTPTLPPATPPPTPTPAPIIPVQVSEGSTPEGTAPTPPPTQEPCPHKGCVDDGPPGSPCNLRNQERAVKFGKSRPPVPADQCLDSLTGHFYLGRRRRRVGTGFARRRRTQAQQQKVEKEDPFQTHRDIRGDVPAEGEKHAAEEAAEAVASVAAKKSRLLDGMLSRKEKAEMIGGIPVGMTGSDVAEMKKDGIQPSTPMDNTGHFPPEDRKRLLENKIQPVVDDARDLFTHGDREAADDDDEEGADKAAVEEFIDQSMDRMDRMDRS